MKSLNAAATLLAISSPEPVRVSPLPVAMFRDMIGKLLRRQELGLRLSGQVDAERDSLRLAARAADPDSNFPVAGSPEEQEEWAAAEISRRLTK